MRYPLAVALAVLLFAVSAYRIPFNSHTAPLFVVMLACFIIIACATTQNLNSDTSLSCQQQSDTSAVSSSVVQSETLPVIDEGELRVAPPVEVPPIEVPPVEVPPVEVPPVEVPPVEVPPIEVLSSVIQPQQQPAVSIVPSETTSAKEQSDVPVVLSKEVSLAPLPSLTDLLELIILIAQVCLILGLYKLIQKA